MDKDKNIKSALINYLLECNIKDQELRDLIKNFSYFIGCTNEQYKYNMTYLESFCNKFISVKSLVNNKNKYFDSILEYSIKNKNDKIKIFRIAMDDFWLFEYNEVFEDGQDDENYNKIIHTGDINEHQLRNDNIKIDFKFNYNNINYYNYSNIIIKNRKMSDINNEIEEFIKKVFITCNKIMEDVRCEKNTII